ncbi:hypothetical protein IQ227_18950 [Anabaena aphanizomenioides LEGE 00250]|uniref:Ribbon-helix-helix protein CopG domain-containing protein n=1 Tax=Sphaerospermopsis aphanizomenoides LEGE 00250 TaxID=2777972 RepID=A0ABR9VHS3_9CYAN|nr:hypothetical protein [Sphaerospermopsis aphanizomenoides]MBE9238046.1 hypothetical protein [Sphaerospermopsis aphanizomenoides LEGE 00250]
MESNQVDTESIINADSPPAKRDDQDKSAREVRFQMVIPAEMCKLIDDARKLTKTSRRAWLLQAAQEKLEREGKL